MWGGSKFNWIILIIGVFLEFIIPYILTFFHPRYSHSREVLSALGGEKIVLFANTITCGL